MKLTDLYTIIVTDKHKECRDFYTEKLGFTVVFEATWFVYMESAGEHAYGVAFMSPEHPSEPPGPDAFSGKGAFLTMQVEDAAAEFERLSTAGVKIAYPLRDEPWGQRRFGIYDPSGTWLDILEQIEPEPGFWDSYV